MSFIKKQLILLPFAIVLVVVFDRFDIWGAVIVFGLLGLIIWAIYRSWWTWFLPK